VPDAPRRIRESSFSLFQYGVVSFVFRVVTSALIARAMGPTMMGVWILMTLLPSYAEAFGRMKSDMAAVYYLGKGRYTLGEVCFTLNLIALVTSGAMCLALALGEPYVTRELFGGVRMPTLLYYSVLATIPLYFISMNYAYLLIHLEDVPAYNLQTVIKTVVPGLLAVVLIYGWRPSLAALVIGLLVGNAGALVVSVFRVHRVEALKPVFDWRMAADLSTFGGRLYLAGLVEHLNQYLTGLIVGIYMPAAQVAYFRMGQDRLQVLDQVPAALNTILYPRVSKTDVAGEAEQLTARSVRILILLLAAAGAAAAVLVWPMVYLLYGAAFLPMVVSVWWLLPGVVAAGATSPIVQYLMGTGRPHYVYRMAIVPLVVQVAAGVPLTIRFGYRGAAVAMSVAFAAHGMVRLAVFVRATRRQTAPLMPRREDVRLLRSFASDMLRGALSWRRASVQQA
jgi:O-antigen/teichoic acid export membrane protein